MSVKLQTYSLELKAQAAAHGVPPAWTLALTFSADMQMDHFYWSVAAHGLSPERTHVIDYGRMARFDELEQIVFSFPLRVCGRAGAGNLAGSAGHRGHPARPRRR